MLREIKSGLVELRKGKIGTLPQKVSRYTLRRFPKVKNFLVRKQMDMKVSQMLKSNAHQKALFENITIVYILNETDSEALARSIISLKKQVSNPSVLFVDLSNNEEKVESIIQNYLPKAERIILPPNERPAQILDSIHQSHLIRGFVLLVNEYAKFNNLSNLLDKQSLDKDKNYCVEFIHRSRDDQKSFYIRQNKVNFYENLNLFRSYFLLLATEKLKEIDLRALFSNDFDVLPGFISADIFEKDFDERNIFFNYFERTFESVKLSKGGKLYNYAFNFDKKVSIIILTRDKVNLLDDCIKSIERSKYKNFEIIIIDHKSNDESKEYLSKLPYKIIRYEDDYNFSHMNNIGASQASGEVLCFLNNDTKVISEDWMEVLGSFAIREDVGAVGPKLLFKNKTIQHAGIKINSVMNSSSHILTYEQDNSISRELNFISSPQAVTGACVFVESKKFLSIGGFDETYKTIWQDIDLCFALEKRGFKTLFIPYVKLYHFESSTRKVHPSTTEQMDMELFQKKWRS